MDEHEDLQARLRATGAHPVDPTIAADHLARMADVRPRSGIRPQLAIAGAFLAGLLIGGSGLAVAGALPDPVQHVAHQAFDPLGVDVPDPERYHGPECGGEVKKNHGAYVRDDHDLAKSQCGKPVKAGKPDADGTDADGEKGPCQGPPPWAGKGNGGMTAAEKAAAQAAREEACGDEDADEADETDAEARDSAEETTTTTVAPKTTTTTAPTTTTTVDESTTTTVDGAGDTDAGGS